MENDVFSLLKIVAHYIGVPLVVFLLISVFLPYLILRISHPARKNQAITLLAFALLGALIGLFTGASRSPVVGGLLPALITFVTGAVGYIASRDTMRSWASLVPFCLVSLLLASILSAFYGSTLRVQSEREESEEKKRMLFYEKVQLEVEKQKLLNVVNGSLKTTK